MPRSARKTMSRNTRSRKPTPGLNSPHTETVQTENPIYFWKPHEVPHGIFSQWYEQDFTVPNDDGTTLTFVTAEQFMMYQKALLFNDATIAAEILATSDPREQRALGRAVKNFDEEVWCANRSRIVEEGNYWKFKGDPDVLLETWGREIVEASPRDRVWGIGFGPRKAHVDKRQKWGMNLLGEALMVVRRKIGEERGVVHVGGDGGLEVGGGAE